MQGTCELFEITLYYKMIRIPQNYPPKNNKDYYITKKLSQKIRKI